MTKIELPLPPKALAARVGTVEGADPLQFYLEEGARLRCVVEELLPADWSWDDKRALDFGCGSARVLRHFAHEAEHGEFWGCDIDRPSIEWDESNLSPPFRFFHSTLAPPLARESESMDLVWAMSVFTHISERWSDWLVEMHRVLAPGGVLVASFLGEGMWEPLVGQPYREDELGMSVLHQWEGPDAWVFHSEWWLREHWGRAFDILDIKQPPRTNGVPQVTHSYISLRKRSTETSKADLERIEATEPREVAGLQTSLRLAQRELAALAADAGRPTGFSDRVNRAELKNQLVRARDLLGRRLRASGPRSR
jgi:SAM-dependent methyltransferase